MTRTLSAARERWPIRGTFTISRGSKTYAEVVLVSIGDGECVGRGECVPYAHYGESIDSVLTSIESVREALQDGLDRQALQSLLPAGAARNALDCALWDLQAKLSGERAWALARIRSPAPVATAYTLSLDAPQKMQAAAQAHAHAPVLKLKLGGAQDLARVQAVRAGAPHSAIIVDANEAWTVADYVTLAPQLQALGVALVEQPLPAGQDAALAEVEHPVPVCADESCHDRQSLAQVVGRYDLVNIKLDKTGGLTEALALQREARQMGLGIMVGCMVSTSLAMAPAMLLTREASFVDLDGPLLLQADRPEGLHFEGMRVSAPSVQLWG